MLLNALLTLLVVWHYELTRLHLLQWVEYSAIIVVIVVVVDILYQVEVSTAELLLDAFPVPQTVPARMALLASLATWDTIMIRFPQFAHRAKPSGERVVGIVILPNVWLANPIGSLTSILRNVYFYIKKPLLDAALIASVFQTARLASMDLSAQPASPMDISTLPHVYIPLHIAIPEK
jgi:hypothetical protein